MSICFARFDGSSNDRNSSFFREEQAYDITSSLLRWLSPPPYYELAPILAWSYIATLGDLPNLGLTKERLNGSIML